MTCVPKSYPQVLVVLIWQVRLTSETAGFIQGKTIKIPGYNPAKGVAKTVSVESEAVEIAKSFKILGVASNGRCIPPTEILPQHASMDVLQEVEKIKIETAKLMPLEADENQGQKPGTPKPNVTSGLRFGSVQALQGKYKETGRFEVATGLTVLVLDGMLAMMNSGSDAMVFGRSPFLWLQTPDMQVALVYQTCIIESIYTHTCMPKKHHTCMPKNTTV